MKQLKKQEVKKLFKEYKREKEVVIVLENIQYARNVAGIFRTADAAQVKTVYLTGISEKPPFGKDLRKASRNKEQSVQWKYEKDIGKVLNTLKANNFKLYAVELTDENAIALEDLKKEISNIEKVAFIFGSEVYGVTKNALSKVDKSIYIPMYGKGASLNVGTSVGIVLYSF